MSRVLMVDEWSVGGLNRRVNRQAAKALKEDLGSLIVASAFMLRDRLYLDSIRQGKCWFTWCLRLRSVLRNRGVYARGKPLFKLSNITFGNILK